MTEHVHELSTAPAGAGALAQSAGRLQTAVQALTG